LEPKTAHAVAHRKDLVGPGLGYWWQKKNTKRAHHTSESGSSRGKILRRNQSKAGRAREQGAKKRRGKRNRHEGTSLKSQNFMTLEAALWGKRHGGKRGGGGKQKKHPLKGETRGLWLIIIRMKLVNIEGGVMENQGIWNLGKKKKKWS